MFRNAKVLFILLLLFSNHEFQIEGKCDKVMARAESTERFRDTCFERVINNQGVAMILDKSYLFMVPKKFRAKLEIGSGDAFNQVGATGLAFKVIKFTEKT